MAYIATSKIHVFPTTKRGTGRRFTEQNLTQLNLSTANKKSFVVSPDISGTKFSFVINGYQFTTSSISDISSLFTSGETEIWAKINLNHFSSYTEPDTDPYNELTGQDNSSAYEGVQFLSSGGADTTTEFYLHILTLNSGVWEIYSDSLLDDGIIDGGLV